MPKSIFLRAPLAALITLSSALCFSADDARWYRVELMVFSQASAPVSESWPPTPELTYPPELQYLIQRDQLPLAPPVTVSALTPETVESIEAGFEDSAVPDPNTPDATGSLTEEDNAGASTSEGFDTALDDENSLIEALLPTSFALLPRSDMEFRGKGAYMERQGGYKVLFHENWAQLIGPKAQSPHIVLPSRSNLAGWPELQGTVRLHLARYLHIETNLWLNTHGKALPRGWNMPAPPLPPGTPYTTPEERAEQEANAALLTEESPAGPIYQNNELLDDTPPELQLENSEGFSAGMPEPDLEQAYPFRHAVLMQQKRRMRSIEVHYLDHPLFGIVVKLTPLDENELAVLAEAEPRPE